MKPRALYLTSEYSLRNGWGTCSVNWIEGLKEEVSEANVFTYKHADNISAPWPVHPILMSAEFGYCKGILTKWDALRIRQLLSGRFDIIHTLVEPLVLLGSQLARHFQAKHLVQLIGTYSVFPTRTRWKRHYQSALTEADKLTSISAYTAKRVSEEYEALDIQVFPLGVSPKEFHANESVPKGKYFLFVGTPKPRKGLLTALQGFQKFLTRHPGYEFRIAGLVDASDYLGTINRFIRNHNLPVRFLGQVSHGELVSQYQACVAHVLPSVSEPFFFEGFGLVHLEANMCGALTIGTRDSANQEVIDEGASGFLVKQGNPDDVQTAMEHAVEITTSNPLKTIQQCVRHARKFEWSVSINALRGEYQSAQACEHVESA